jgi:hypothetical protein
MTVSTRLQVVQALYGGGLDAINASSVYFNEIAAMFATHGNKQADGKTKTDSWITETAWAASPPVGCISPNSRGRVSCH